MKKLLVMLVAVGLLAGTANAATLWMQFEGGTNEVTLLPSQNVNVEVWVDLINGDSLSAVGSPWWPVNTQSGDMGAYPNGVEGLYEVSGVGAAPNWGTGSQPGIIGQIQANINVGANQPSTDSLHGPGSFMVGLITIHQNDITNGHAGDPNVSGYFNDSTAFDFYPIMFGGDPTVIPQLSNQVGADYTFDPRYSSSYANYYTWGQGASAISTKKWAVGADPLIVHCIPEPASLSLLALGGLALLRRR